MMEILWVFEAQINTRTNSLDIVFLKFLDVVGEIVSADPNFA